MRVSSPSGLVFQFTSSGAIERIDHGDITLNLFIGNELDGSPANLWLRLRVDGEITGVPLLGPASQSRIAFSGGHLEAYGIFAGIGYRVIFLPAADSPAWFWHIELANETERKITCDLVLTQDVGIANYGLIRQNEYFVSQYIDHQPLDAGPHGAVIVSRQNQPMDGKFPSLTSGSLGRAAFFATDALQTHGKSRQGNFPFLSADLPATRLQHEHSLVALQEEEITLEPGESTRCGFFHVFTADQPEPTTPENPGLAAHALELPEAGWPAALPDVSGLHEPAENVFSSAPIFPVEDPSENDLAAWFGTWRHEEKSSDGEILSFFTGGHTHVVTRRKEALVLRPHGHMLRSGAAIVPDEAALTSTVWMSGVFHSLVTQGHVSINRFLSTAHSYLGLFQSHGVRIFVGTGAEQPGGWRRLGIPSAFAMTDKTARWIYQGEWKIDVTAEAAADGHRLLLSISSEKSARFLITFHSALNGDDGNAPGAADFKVEGNTVRVKAAPDSDVGRRFPGGFFEISATGCIAEWSDASALFPDGDARGLPFLCLTTPPAETAGAVITGHLIAETENLPQRGAEKIVMRAEGGSSASDLAEISEIIPWFVHNAMVHYLSPRGLEQYSGGGWGTRDVCQGAAELLLALDEPAALRDMLIRVFRQQNPDGDWPQWFMFFERERGIRPGDSHGDIVYWPLVALSQYLLATGDAAFLDERIPFFENDRESPATSVREHVNRALEVIRGRVITGTRLAAYGHGDWNDALQPAKPEMREKLCSSWTVTLNHQTLTALSRAYLSAGETEQAAAFALEAGEVLAAFQEHLLPDGVVTGLAWFGDSGTPVPLLHPRDMQTGLKYSLLPMIHAIINDMFTPEQTAEHLRIIRDHLRGPDGAHLFDKPIRYHGGKRTWFQRAETASYFGREIGIMYMHAHLRYAEALARTGDARGFFEALRQAVPILSAETTPSAAPRQANCYYSSSDPAFADRYLASEHYADALTGNIPLEGGWRIYSSGAGITTRLILHTFLGIRHEGGNLVIDPVIPPELNGMTAEIRVNHVRWRVSYHVGPRGCGPTEISVNGKPVRFQRAENRYRTGAAEIPWSEISLLLTPSENTMRVVLG